ncbi:hypothetical protein EC917_11260 [Bacillus thuringiensis]|uniref:Uncharacterized protein n=1 Tax=Bacillus thuringiensis TaxID=1428 RepID=A0A4R4BEH0_BACTU|nr:hypothetical protein EC917_11260 [Bacillus thuringiensis]TCW53111.1 hypothetical protein EC910_11260 [Bacillus thuringiensis]
MKHSIENVSTSYIIRLILNDLETFITAGKRQLAPHQNPENLLMRS